MTATTSATTASTTGRGRTALLLLAAVVVAVTANAIVAAAAMAAGADPSFAALTPIAYIPTTLVGIGAGYAGWLLVRRVIPRAATALRVVVPVALVLSFTPDLILLATDFIPGASLIGVIGLMLMHPIVVGVAVPVFQRIAPASNRI